VKVFLRAFFVKGIHMSKNDQAINHDRYQVIPRTLIFIFDQSGRVLLIKGAPDKQTWPNKYNGIGGHVEAGEDVLTAAKRELLEETGFISDELKFCGQIMIDIAPDVGIALFIFSGNYHNQKLVDSCEGELVWVSLSDFDKYPVVQDLLELVPLVVKCKSNNDLFFGKYTFDEDENMLICIA
jgi:8-oxo-dGTP diphosphatase